MFQKFQQVITVGIAVHFSMWERETFVSWALNTNYQRVSKQNLSERKDNVLKESFTGDHFTGKKGHNSYYVPQIVFHEILGELRDIAIFLEY